MRLVFWGLVLVGLGYAAYAVMTAGWQYFQVITVVDEVLEPRNLASLPTARDVRAKILKTVAEAGVPLGERDLNVTHVDRMVTVTVVWSVPVVIYKGESVLAIPLSVTRSRPTTGGSAYRGPAGFARASAMSLRTRSFSSLESVTAM